MTVAATPTYAELAWTGVETTFAPGILAQNVANIVVQYRAGDGTISTIINGVHLTLTKAGDPGMSGLISAVPAAMPAAPGTVLFSRRSPDTQATPFVDLAKYSASTHEKLHDAAALRDGELRRDLLRAFKGPGNEIQTDLPAAAARANAVFRFDALGNPRMAPPTEDSTALAQTYADQAGANATQVLAALAATGITPAGTTNAAFVAACTAAAAAGVGVFLAGVTYTIDPILFGQGGLTPPRFIRGEPGTKLLARAASTQPTVTICNPHGSFDFFELSTMTIDCANLHQNGLFIHGTQAGGCTLSTIKVLNAIGTGIIFHGEQGFGIYYNNFLALHAQSCGGNAFNFYSSGVPFTGDTTNTFLTIENVTPAQAVKDALDAATAAGTTLPISGAGIPDGATVASINVGTQSLTMSVAATATAIGAALNAQDGQYYIAANLTLGFKAIDCAGDGFNFDYATVAINGGTSELNRGNLVKIGHSISLKFNDLYQEGYGVSAGGYTDTPGQTNGVEIYGGRAIAGVSATILSNPTCRVFTTDASGLPVVGMGGFEGLGIGGANPIAEAINSGANGISFMRSGATKGVVFDGLRLGTPTGGDQGAGTLNCTGAYVNGKPLLGAVAFAHYNGNTLTLTGQGVTSVTHNAAGDYTFNLTDPMSDSNFTALVSGISVTNGTNICYAALVSQTATTVRVQMTASDDGAGAGVDSTVTVVVYGTRAP